MELPDDLKAVVLADVARESPPARQQLRPGILLAVGMSLVIAFIGFEALGGVHWVGRPEGYIRIATVAFALLATAATLYVFAPTRSMFGPISSVRLRVGLVLLAPLLLMGLMAWLNSEYGTGGVCVEPRPDGSLKTRIGKVCFDLSTVLGAFPVLALILARRSGLAVRPVQAGFGTGIAVGSWTGVAMTMSCECTGLSHIALGHILPMFVLALFGGLVAWRASKKRR